MNNASMSLLVCATVGLKVLTAMAAEPYIVPTGVQEFAVEAGLPKALGIDWTNASDKNIAYYMNTLTAIDAVAQNIARANNRKDPSFDDYLAASAAWCKFPLPNKPPEVAGFSDSVEGAFVSTVKQDSIGAAVGPVLLEGSLDGFKNFLINEKPGIDEYEANVLDFSRISE